MRSKIDNAFEQAITLVKEVEGNKFKKYDFALYHYDLKDPVLEKRKNAIVEVMTSTPSLVNEAPSPMTAAPSLSTAAPSQMTSAQPLSTAAATSKIEESILALYTAPTYTFDIVNLEYNVILAAAIYVLDEIKRAYRMDEARKLLSLPYDMLRLVDFPDNLFDPIHEENAIRAAMYLIENRNGMIKRGKVKAMVGGEGEQEGGQNGCTPSDGGRGEFNPSGGGLTNSGRCNSGRGDNEHTEYNITNSPTDGAHSTMEAYKKLIALIPEEVRTRACDAFITLRGQMLQVYTTCVDKMPTRTKTDLFNLKCFQQDFIEYCKQPTPYKTVSNGNTDLAEQVESLIDPILIPDPYMICFASVVLLTEGNAYAWSYGPAIAALIRAAILLPWRIQWRQQLEGHSLSINAKPPLTQCDRDNRYEIIMMSSGNVYSYPQLIYACTCCVPPRDLHALDSTRQALDGMDGIEEVMSVAEVMHLMRDRSTTVDIGEGDAIETTEGADSSDGTEDIDRVDAEHSADGADSVDPAELANQVTGLKSELRQLKVLLHEADVARRHDSELIQSLRAEMDRNRGELKDLRELVFSGEIELSAPAEEIKFPYVCKSNIVVFGGHESWLKEIKPLLPNVRFMGTDRTTMIRYADLVVFQTNRIGHSLYNSVMDICRRHGIPVRYLSNASAVKCAKAIREIDLERNE